MIGGPSALGIVRGGGGTAVAGARPVGRDGDAEWRARMATGGRPESGRAGMLAMERAANRGPRPVGAWFKASGADEAPVEMSLDDRISSGEFSDDSSDRIERIAIALRNVCRRVPGPGVAASRLLDRLAQWSRNRRESRPPIARGNFAEIAGQPFFIPLFKLYSKYGPIFRLCFGPKTFVVVSDPELVRQILITDADKFSKGMLSEILDFIMGQGLIPANGEVWRTRRRAIVPAMHKKFVESMIEMFGDCTHHGMLTLRRAAVEGNNIDLENFFSRLALDIIGKAVFNYEFDSVTHDDPVIKAVYTALREAERRSTAMFPWWNLPFAKVISGKQRRVGRALIIINDTLEELVSKCKRLVEEENVEFDEEFLSREDPSILHFLLASGDEISDNQLRDDLMTLLIAGHETTAAVLTWTFYELAKHPEIMQRVQKEADEVIGDRLPTLEDLKNLHYSMRVINEAMRLYPQPPVLIRRTLEEVSLGKYVLSPNTDIFISPWNMHRSPDLWDEPEKFNPDRFPLNRPVPNESTEGFRYIPFGGGKRKCIGDQFALYESIVALAMILRRFDVALDPEAPPVEMTTGATIHTTNGLNLRLHQRVMSLHTEQESALSNGHTNSAVEALEKSALNGYNGSVGVPLVNDLSPPIKTG